MLVDQDGLIVSVSVAVAVTVVGDVVVVSRAALRRLIESITVELWSPVCDGTGTFKASTAL